MKGYLRRVVDETNMEKVDQTLETRTQSEGGNSPVVRDATIP